MLFSVLKGYAKIRMKLAQMNKKKQHAVFTLPVCCLLIVLIFIAVLGGVLKCFQYPERVEYVPAVQVELPEAPDRDWHLSIGYSERPSLSSGVPGDGAFLTPPKIGVPTQASGMSEPVVPMPDMDEGMAEADNRIFLPYEIWMGRSLGMMQRNPNLLYSEFADLKQVRKGGSLKSSPMARCDAEGRSQVRSAPFRALVGEVVRHGWSRITEEEYVQVRGIGPVGGTYLYEPPIAGDVYIEKLFGVGAGRKSCFIHPGGWCMRSHVRVHAPASGRWRFAGYCDDTMAVRLNGRLVLVCGGQGKEQPPVVEKGEPFDLKEGEVCDIEIVVADEGGTCGYALFTEYGDNEGEECCPRYELFRTGFDLPQAEAELPFCADSHVWMGVWDD